MPWSNQSGGGWKSGGGPWGQPPSGGGSGGGGGRGGGGPQPDLEEILRRGQDRLRQAFPGGGGFGGPFTILIALVLAAIVGFYAFTVRVATDEQGVVLRFGEYVRQLPPGLHFRLPYPIEQVLLPKVTRQNRLEIGGVGASPTRPQESLMLTGDENIVDIDFVVFWKISDAPNYLFNVQNPEGTVRDVAESAMREVVGRSNIERILTQDRTETEQAVQQLMQRTLDRYKAGVEILQVQLQKADPPAQVIDAFRDVQAAKADQERLQNEAEAYANKVIPEARGEAERILQQAQGYRDRVVAEAKGEADRFLKIFDAYKTAPDVTRKRIFIETMQDVLSGRDKVILDEKGGQGVVPYLPLSEIKKPSTGSSRTSEGGQ
ncbi:MAG: FtsH protease activity modulator HflK [Methyloligella sp. ZOD6]